MPALRIHNTLTRKKELFAPRIAKKVGMYVCGPTVYDFIHVGNARTFTAFDMVARWLRATAYDVTYVRHITDDCARLADIGLKCCERVNDVVKLLGEDGGNFEAIMKTCEEIDRLESDADRVMRAAVSKLFREEQDVREVIKLKAIYELLEEITDRCLDVANLCEGISLENS